MSSLDPNDEARDAGLGRALRSLPLPGTPATVAGQVRRRLRRRRLQQVASVAAVFVAASLVVWRPWAGSTTAPVGGPGSNTVVAAAELSPQELDELFGPPPVDGLTILSRRDDVVVVALNRLEGPKR